MLKESVLDKSGVTSMFLCLRYTGAMNISTQQSNRQAEPGFGTALRAWRQAKGQSQLGLALDAGVSTRHVSYLETGRASPSREMVLTLARAMEVPLRGRNQLLVAAGFAPLYRETPLGAPSLDLVRDALEFQLAAMEPNPVFVVNRRYDIVDANATGHWLLSTFTTDLSRFAQPYNMAQLIARPEGMLPFLHNGEEVQRKVFGRLCRDLGSAQVRDSRDDALLSEIAPILAGIGDSPALDGALPLMVGVSFRRGELALNFFTLIATLGTALDLTLQEMRIETLFPADADTKALLLARNAGD